MLRSKRTFVVALSLAIGVLAVAVLHTLDLLPGADQDASLVNTAARRPKPRPTAGDRDRTQAGPVEPLTHPAPATDEVGVPSSLVPTDACLYVEVASFATVERVVRDLVGRFEPSAAVMFDGDMLLTQMLASLGGDAADVDRRRPLGMAFSMPGGGEPRPTLLLPVHAPEEFARGLRLPPGFAQPRLAARYVGLTLGPDYPVSRAGAPIALGLEPATVSLRFVLDPLRAQVSAGMDQARAASRDLVDGLDIPVPIAYELGQDFAYRMIESMDHIDLALDLDGERMAMHCSLGFSEGSSMARPLPEDPVDLMALAAFARPDDDLVAVAGWDQAFLDEVILPFVDELSGLAGSEADEAVFDQVGSCLSCLPSLGSSVGLFASFDVGHAHLALVGRPQDPQGLLAMAGTALAAVDRETLPVSIGSWRGVDLEDGHAARLVIDLATRRRDEDGASARVRQMLALAFGSEQVELQLTARGGWLLVTLGSDPAWRDELVASATEEGPTAEVPEDLARLVARTAGSSPGFAYSVDLLSAQRNLMALMAEQMGLDARAELRRLDSALGEDPLPLSAYGAVQGDSWVCGGELELARMLTLLEMTGK